MDAFPDYRLRIKSPQLCDTSVTQYSGYMDTDEDKHFYFWFFEARNVPSDEAPLILWTNGGPGCSSFTGLLMEHGPCRVSKGGNSTEYNPYGWNDRANIIFIDQPLNTGFSYGKKVDNSYDAGKDVNVFLRMFYKSFPQYANSELHVFGESYGGHYVPAIGKAIHEANLELVDVLPLVSIGIGNGLVDVLTQHAYYAKMACNSTYPPVLPQETCDKMDAAVPTCDFLVKACYKWQTRLACIPAEYYCLSRIMGPYSDGTHNNPYDVRKKCVGDNLCYEIEDDIDRYLNIPAVQQELGVDVPKFVGCNQKVSEGFLLNGDWMKPLVREIPPLLEAGIRVLNYAGDADWICNWYGNKAWSLKLDWSGKDGFSGADDTEWNVDSEQAGEARTFENFTFLRVFGAGHMVPYDQPKNSLDMINRWLDGKPF
ncbi:peptidase S10, serine carboxypeptidase [Linderina pennispora]|uniref:Carboxypeptidase n=1 Tax=Linderina pennispora TaxID=61395 RepID=A0A1Y1VPY7_9FUNG|nr:peptidase S10, serine carboxypeptidase [Linderina pennispora]ORX63371.1 peptidase S10, serine carboxypeptidase [Linderina pennispora]